MTTQKKKGMTREQAAELYRDLQKAMAKMKVEKGAAPKGATASGIDAKAIAASISAAMKRDDAGERRSVTRETMTSEIPDISATPLPVTRGQYAAFVFVIVFAIARVSMSAMEAMGIGQLSLAEATMKPEVQEAPVARAVFNPQTAQGLTREEVKVLTSLDARRAELEDRSEKLDQRQTDLDRREREMALRLTQLKELSDRLSSERDKNEKKKSAQLDQLANVYGSMNPPEAAALIEQLDVTIALSLLERMPEKRIGQILALMRPERALSITKMLSAKGQ
ncbi:MAG: hypothetical protein K1X79_05315 [Oligoflexia bacterium]|nr:hypothetical protein [Oligoflexia bacterium]